MKKRSEVLISKMFSFSKVRVFLAGFLAAFFFACFSFSFAEEADSSAVVNRRAQLEQELEKLESQIENYRGVISEKQKQSTTLERDIAILNAKIEKAKLEIRARDINIAQLSQNIGEHEVTIGSLLDKIEREKDSLAELLRRTNEMDASSLVEVMLKYENLSDFFVDQDSFETIYGAVQDSLNEIRGDKDRTEKEKENLEERKMEQIQLRSVQELEKKRLAQSESEKQKILKETKGEEAKYQKILIANQKTAAQIRSELFMLRGTAAIPFEKALEYANIASHLTGIRPAFLLGVIAEESNLGENVGTGTWQVDMHPTRDRPVFKELTDRLGLDPDKMPVSKKPWYGWGGAMGPAQFIPSTWVMYEKKIAALSGHNPPNPWDPYDAFIASAILLQENGAVAGNYSKERLAALRYFAGWKNAQKSAYAFYGDDVMELAAKYQNQIDILSR